MIYKESYIKANWHLSADGMYWRIDDYAGAVDSGCILHTMGKKTED